MHQTPYRQEPTKEELYDKAPNGMRIQYQQKIKRYTHKAQPSKPPDPEPKSDLTLCNCNQDITILSLKKTERY